MNKRFQDLIRALDGAFVGRSEVVTSLVTAAIAGEHVVLFGPPGTAKSAIANAFTASLGGASCFSWLLTKFTVPDELFGSISMRGLETDSYRRVTTGKLPEAEVAFLDEVFKGSSAILNTLLSALNERVIYNDGKAQAIPLRVVVGASNEFPEGPELAALYDRFLVRHWVDYVGGGEFVTMLGLNPAPAVPVVTLAELDAARVAASKVKVGASVFELLAKLRAVLANGGVVVSDRRWKRSIGMLRATAWLAGDPSVSEEHCEVLRSVLWGDLSQCLLVDKEIEKIVGAGPGVEASRTVEMISKLLAGVPSDLSASGAQEKIVSVSGECKRAQNRITSLLQQSTTPAQKTRVEREGAKLDALIKPFQLQVRQALGLG
jgi:MoxR-like ATPase